MVIVLWCGSWFDSYPAEEEEEEEEEEEGESCLLWLDWLLRYEYLTTIIKCPSVQFMV